MLEPIKLEIGKIYKTESSRVLASLIRILGNLDLAEEAMQAAFSIAMEKWPKDGIPNNPYSWLVSTGKYKTIDTIRRTNRGKELLAEVSLLDCERIEQPSVEQLVLEKHLVEDDQLRLIFYCCHPDLSLDSRIALALREVCGMTTLEISQAYLVPIETIKKRISRAKARIKQNNIAYEIPTKTDLKRRMEAVLHVIYLIFNEGYCASVGEDHIRKELTEEAIYLSRQLVSLISTTESIGLLALLLLQESRREARMTENGDIISLDNQDRSRWNQNLIQEGLQLIQQAVMSGRLGPYTLQAAIASVHSVAESVKKTQWELIIAYYDMLLTINPAPIIELNRAIAVGTHQGPNAGLDIIEQLIKQNKLSTYPTLFAAKAEFSKQLGSVNIAKQAYQRAIELVRPGPEERYLKEQLANIS